MDSSKIFPTGTLHKTDVYPFLHKNHQNKAPELLKVVKEMKSEGLLSAYWKKATKKNVSADKRKYIFRKLVLCDQSLKSTGVPS